MSRLRAVPWPVWLLAAVGTLLTAAAVIGHHYLDVVGDESGLLSPVLAGIVPAFTWLAIGVAAGMLLVRRSQTRQEREELAPGWGKRILTSLAWVLLTFAAATVLMWLLWFAGDVWIARQSAALTGAGTEFSLPRSPAVTLSLVFAPGLTGALPAVLLGSRPEPDPD